MHGIRQKTLGGKSGEGPIKGNWGADAALSPDGRILDTVSTERHNNRHDENEDVPDGFEPERIKSSGR